jgi:acetoin:2,6-dichlorophenolindophenol oxidoreductase subunit alpha
MKDEIEAARARIAGDRELLRGMYELMLLAREMDRVAGGADGHWHACEGEEAVLAACYAGLRPDDWLVPHYRGMLAASRARGAPLRQLFAGLTGKVSSNTRGHYRSDVCGPIEHKVIGLYSGALGPSLEYAAGTALAARLDGRDSVTVCVFGDGTSSRGNFHEALNLAAVLALPVVYVCQNNQLAISTPSSRGVGARSIADRGAAYGIPGLAADGNDAIALRAVVEAAMARARRGEGPTLIEALTYRVSGHLVADPAGYRSEEEVAAWRERDPIARLRAHLLGQDMLRAGEDEDLRRTIAAEVDTAFAQAASDSEPGQEELALDQVFPRSST